MKSSSRRNGPQSRIGILTFHRPTNDGSVLQAICLYQLLAKHFGRERVRILDYLHFPSDHFSTLNFGKSLLKFPKVTKTPRAQLLRRETLLTSPMLLMTAKALSSALRKNGITHLVMGSDTIWDANTVEFKRTSFNPFFENLTEVCGTPFSYFAASADPLFEGGLSAERRLHLQKSIRAAAFVGCRDEGTASLARDLAPSQQVRLLPDPTLLNWPTFLLPDSSPSSADGPVGVQIASASVRHEITRELDRARVPWLDLYSDPRFNVDTGGAQALVRGISARSLLSALVTDRFHGAIIFMQSNRSAAKPVVVIQHGQKWPSDESKLKDLMGRLSASKMFVKLGDQDRVETVSLIVDLLQRPLATTKSMYESCREVTSRASSDVSDLFGIIESNSR